ncbi:MAG: WYL domain-containing protein [Lachnospiraceae bacterium]|nr:WYL domain-containing protein [Lachnospiraceae bacterium]
MECNESEVVKEVKTGRVLELFFRALKGENLCVRELAEEYHVSTRSLSRDINELKNFLAERRDMFGNAELEYSNQTKRYHLKLNEFITNKELLAITKVLIGCRAFNTDDLLVLLRKLKAHTSTEDRRKLDNLIMKEVFWYTSIHFDCNSIIDMVWEITEYIEAKRLITITYHKMDRSLVRRKIKPVSVLFSEYYFYLIAYESEGEEAKIPKYFRIDRIVNIVAHREYFQLQKSQEVDEGSLRNRSQFMFPGKLRRIRFEFSGPSVQAVLDRIPTAKIIDHKEGKDIIEAEVYGTGIKMFLLSQGSWVKVLSPQDFVEEMREEVNKMLEHYR